MKTVATEFQHSMGHRPRTSQIFLKIPRRHGFLVDSFLSAVVTSVSRSFKRRCPLFADFSQPLFS
jgi:hypothetical protein